MKIRIWLILGVFVCGVSWLFGSVIAFSANFSQNGWQADDLNKGNSVEVAIQWVVVSTSCWNVFIELFAIELEQLLGRIFFLLENGEFYQCEGNRLELLWKRVFRFMWTISRKFGDCITLVLNQIMSTHNRNIEGCTCKLSLCTIIPLLHISLVRGCDVWLFAVLFEKLQGQTSWVKKARVSITICWRSWWNMSETTAGIITFTNSLVNWR